MREPSQSGDPWNPSIALAAALIVIVGPGLWTLFIVLMESVSGFRPSIALSICALVLCLIVGVIGIWMLPAGRIFKLVLTPIYVGTMGYALVGWGLVFICLAFSGCP